MKYNIIIIALIAHTAHAYKAVTVVPIADLVGAPQGKVDEYATFPLSGASKPWLVCPRTHQLLFQEIVEVNSERGDEVRIYIPQFFYATVNNPSPQNCYWTKKSNLVSLSQLKKRKVDTHLLPKPIDYSARTAQHDQIATLHTPWRDNKSKTTYSAGTRFVAAKKGPFGRTVPAYMLDAIGMKMRKVSLPKTHCFVGSPQTRDEKVALFVQLVQQWAHQKNGTIPYVFGGCSFAGTCAEKNFFTAQPRTIAPGKTVDAYLPVKNKSNVCTGFDCAGIIARAAQLAGLPYFCKNTTALSQSLQTLTHNDSVQNGDLIWFSGHVIIISDVEKQLLVEARSYDHGYGKVHEVPLSDVFHNITTYKDLADALHNKKPLHRKDKDGKLRDTFAQFKILKMRSVFS